MRYPIPLIIAALVVTTATVVILNLTVVQPVLWTNFENNTVYTLVLGQGVGVYLAGRDANVASNDTIFLYAASPDIPVVLYAAKPVNLTTPNANLTWYNGTPVVITTQYRIVYQKVVTGVYTPLLNASLIPKALLTDNTVVGINVNFDGSNVVVTLKRYFAPDLTFKYSPTMYKGTSFTLKTASARLDYNVVVDYGIAVYIAPTNSVKVVVS